jgi:hypothetical protein
MASYPLKQVFDSVRAFHELQGVMTTLMRNGQILFPCTAGRIAQFGSGLAARHFPNRGETASKAGAGCCDRHAKAATRHGILSEAAVHRCALSHFEELTASDT